jgi:hypothetical protein
MFNGNGTPQAHIRRIGIVQSENGCQNRGLVWNTGAGAGDGAEPRAAGYAGGLGGIAFSASHQNKEAKESRTKECKGGKVFHNKENSKNINPK